MLTGSDTSPLTVDMEMADGTAVVKLYGELDLAVRFELWEQLAQVAEKKTDVLVIDLGEVTFLDCGAAVMMIQMGQLMVSGRKTVLRSVPPQVRRLLELTGLNSQCVLADDFPHESRFATRVSTREAMDTFRPNGPQFGYLPAGQGAGPTTGVTGPA